ncbi:MAG: MBL fold metallo-hydrolase [Ruminococcus sp.]|uniref:MBL fold metallo-hydrolase n=1 Tax=Ruminococcus sp. TaxID=41978 RepID=UPI002872C6E1|nr:MBL fold metallo-hydrolase [Ruminococcus sp.]MBQ3285296.1 MBL fold metallo-hydrolase [Ruminococcus sp.]
MAKIVPLFSSSKGNSYYIQGNGSAILIDAGRNLKQLELAMSQNGLSTREVRAVFVTHEHTDHISALNVLLKRYDIPLYASRGTLDYLTRYDKVPTKARLNVIENIVETDDFRVQRVDTSHDAAEPCGYFITTPDGRRMSIVTDTGFLTEDARLALSRSHLAVVESNHDIDMLREGPYPYILKKRILSDNGHLSNAACAEALPAFVGAGLTRIILGHLSEENNTPHLAVSESVGALNRAGMIIDNDYTLDVAPVVTNGKSVIF